MYRERIVFDSSSDDVDHTYVSSPININASSPGMMASSPGMMASSPGMMGAVGGSNKVVPMGKLELGAASPSEPASPSHPVINSIAEDAKVINFRTGNKSLACVYDLRHSTTCGGS